MKLNRRKLRRLILREFLNTSGGQNQDIENMIGGFPPIIFDPPGGGGGGGGSSCSYGSPRYNRIFDKVFNSVEDWMEFKFGGMDENGNEKNTYKEYENHLRKFVNDKGIPIVPLIGRHEMKRIITVLEEIVEYICYEGGSVYQLLWDPTPVFDPNN